MRTLDDVLVQVEPRIKDTTRTCCTDGIDYGSEAGKGRRPLGYRTYVSYGKWVRCVWWVEQHLLGVPRISTGNKHVPILSRTSSLVLSLYRYATAFIPSQMTSNLNTKKSSQFLFASLLFLINAATSGDSSHQRFSFVLIQKETAHRKRLHKVSRSYFPTGRVAPQISCSRRRECLPNICWYLSRCVSGILVEGENILCFKEKRKRNGCTIVGYCNQMREENLI